MQNSQIILEKTNKTLNWTELNANSNYATQLRYVENVKTFENSELHILYMFHSFSLDITTNQIIHEKCKLKNRFWFQMGQHFHNSRTVEPINRGKTHFKMHTNSTRSIWLPVRVWSSTVHCSSETDAIIENDFISIVRCSVDKCGNCQRKLCEITNR